MGRRPLDITDEERAERLKAQVKAQCKRAYNKRKDRVMTLCEVCNCNVSAYNTYHMKSKKHLANLEKSS